MTNIRRTLLALALGSTLSLPTLAADSGAIKGLWDFTVNEQPIQVPNPSMPGATSYIPVPGIGSQGSSTLTFDEDFAPNRAGNEPITFAVSSSCTQTSTTPPSFSFTYRDRRIFRSTEGEELAMFDVPAISLAGIAGERYPPPIPGASPTMAPPTNRSSSGFATDRRTRLYVYTRALYPPTSSLASVWYLGVFGLDGTLLWDRTFRPLAAPASDDYLWNIVPARSAVGPLLSQGKNKDVIRIFRTKFDPTQGAVMNRYTFLELLTGVEIMDKAYPVVPPQ